VGLRAVLD